MEKLTTSLWVELPLKESEYAKDKVGLSMKFKMEGEMLTLREFEERKEEIMNLLFDDTANELRERATDLLDKLVDERVEEIRAEYEEKLSLAREEVIKLSEKKK